MNDRMGSNRHRRCIAWVAVTLAWPVALAWFVALVVLGGSAQADEAAAALEVTFEGQAVYPDDRPAWLDDQPTTSDSLDTWTVVTPPLSTPELCGEALRVQLRAAAETYLETLLDDPQIASQLHLDDDWIAERISAEHRYRGSVGGGLQPRHEAAAQLHFLPEDRQWLLRQATELEQRKRLRQLAVVTTAGGCGLFGFTAALSLWRRRVELRSSSQPDA